MCNRSGHVGQVLGREERSLGSLLQEFCGVRKQKQHQLADWRQRYTVQPLERSFLRSLTETLHDMRLHSLSDGRLIPKHLGA